MKGLKDLKKRLHGYIRFSFIYHTFNNFALVEAINGNYKKKIGPSMKIVIENKNKFRKNV